MAENSQENIIPTPSEVINKKTFNKSWVLITGLVILTAVLLVISLTSKNASLKPNLSKNSQANIAHTRLSISQEAGTTAVAGRYETDVNINPGGNKVTGVALELSYDPKVLGNVSISPGGFIANAIILRKEVDTTKGTIFLTLSTPKGTKGIEKAGVLAVISFSKVGTGPASINFLPETLVTDQRYDRSVLDGTDSGNILLPQ